MTKLVRCGINFYADVDNKKAVNDRDALQNTKLMEHYTHLLGQLQYEGAGIWSRFNIMFGINVSLFGLETVLFNSICQTSEYLTFIIAFGGLSFSIWSIYVMQRLWSYHEHWKNMLCEAEKAFPDEYVKLFTKIPSNLKREKKSWELWLKSYTQPFFAILSLIWLLIMVLNHAIYTDMLNKESLASIALPPWLQWKKFRLICIPSGCCLITLTRMVIWVLRQVRERWIQVILLHINTNRDLCLI